MNRIFILLWIFVINGCAVGKLVEQNVHPLIIVYKLDKKRSEINISLLNNSEKKLFISDSKFEISATEDKKSLLLNNVFDGSSVSFPFKLTKLDHHSKTSINIDLKGHDLFNLESIHFRIGYFTNIDKCNPKISSTVFEVYTDCYFTNREHFKELSFVEILE